MVTSEGRHSKRQKMPFSGQLMGQNEEWIVKNCINAQAIQPILQPVILSSSLWTSSTMSLSCLTEFPVYGNQMKETTRTPVAVTVEKQLVKKESMDLPSFDDSEYPHERELQNLSDDFPADTAAEAPRERTIPTSLTGWEGLVQECEGPAADGPYFRRSCMVHKQTSTTTSFGSLPVYSGMTGGVSFFCLSVHFCLISV